LSTIPFWKVESVGNDFVLIHLDDESSDDFLRHLAIKTCDRRFGIGGDGLLAIRMEGEVLVDRMFNPDGTEDFCGNGLRCVARHAHSQGWVGSSFVIRHGGQDIPTRIEGDLVSTVVAPASYDPSRIPAKFTDTPEKTFRRMPIWSGSGESVEGSALTTGSTHVVVIGGTVNDDLFFRASPEIEIDPQFPERTSVIWADEMGPRRIKIRVWERGVGETLGCGTGSAAAAVEFMRRHDIGGTIEVVNPGGIVRVSADSWDAPLTIAGDAVEVYSGEFFL
jgi:diaminopimelate epimerase